MKKRMAVLMLLVLGAVSLPALADSPSKKGVDTGKDAGKTSKTVGTGTPKSAANTGGATKPAKDPKGKGGDAAGAK